MYDLGYLQRLDKAALPNVEKNLLPALRHPAADPDREFTVPWQSGMTGIIVRTDLAPDIDSVSDLYDPKYKGHVTMLTEMRDTVPMTLKSMGIDPDEATTDQWLAAVDKIEAAAASGQIRKFTGNDYIRELASGERVGLARLVRRCRATPEGQPEHRVHDADARAACSGRRASRSRSARRTRRRRRR